MDGVGSTLGSGVDSWLGSTVGDGDGDGDGDADGVGDGEVASGAGLVSGTARSGDVTAAGVVGHDAAARPWTSTRVVEVQPLDEAWLTVMPVTVAIAATPVMMAAARWPRTDRG